MTVIDAAASSPHFVDHIAPVWHALPRNRRGRFYAVTNPARRRASALGITARNTRPVRGNRTPVLIASFGDVPHIGGRPFHMIEHGTGQCVAPWSRVLTADMRWIDASDLEVGMRLVGFDEHPSPDGKRRRYNEATVTHLDRSWQQCFVLTLEDGTKLLSSYGHRWLRYNRGGWHWAETRHLQPADMYPTRSSSLLRMFDVWDDDRTWEGGYLAAAFDGEGHFSLGADGHGFRRIRLGFCQKPNGMLDLVRHELDARGFTYRQGTNETNGVVRIDVAGGVREIMRFIGSIRPRRLVDNLGPLEGGAILGDKVRVVSRDFVGLQEVVGILTDTATLVVDGFASHNSYGGEPPPGTTPDYDHTCPMLSIACPNERTAYRNRLHHPHATVAVTGTPKLDAWVNRRFPDNDPPVVAFAWHWPNRWIAPESNWAFPHWADAVAELAARPESDRGYRIVGHGHPRAYTHLVGFYRRARIPYVATLEKVWEVADVVVFDNTSAGWESAAVGIPVVMLDAPTYRRDVDHGLRFWEWADAGLRCGTGTADELHDAVTRTLRDDPAAPVRAAAVADLYPCNDGGSARRVVDLVTSIPR